MVKYPVKVVLINIAVIGLFVFDRFTKIFFEQNPGKEVFLIINDLLSVFFQYSKNYNIAFGIQLSQVILYPLILMALIFLVFLFIKNLKDRNLSGSLFTALILVGAVSNFVDRLLYGYVIDFINMVAKTYPWPVFNIADIFITVGVGGWIVKKL